MELHFSQSEARSDNTNTSVAPYIQAIKTAQKTANWLKTVALPWLIGIGLASGGLSYMAWLIRLQVGAGLFYGYAAISTGLFAWAAHTAIKMIKFEQQGGIIENDLRWLVFGKLATASFSVIAVATIGFLEPSFSFLNNDLPIAGISIGNGKKVAKIQNKGDRIPEGSIITNSDSDVTEFIAPSKNKKANTVSASVSTAYSAEAMNKMQYTFFLRVFKEREGYNPRIYWDKTQWSIGYGSYANDLHKKTPNMTVSRDEAYELALKELDVCRAKAKADFSWLNREQELALMDLYYNAGKHCITGLKGQRKAGTLLAVMNRYAKEPNSVTYDQLYSAFVEAKDCKDCEKGKRCGHQIRRKLNVLQFLSTRSSKDFANWKQAYDSILNNSNNKIAGL